MKRLIIYIVLLFAMGCSLKPILNKDPLYEKALINTKRAQIINSFETKALIDITHLNPIYKEFKNPTFLIAIYNNYDNTLINSEFNITLNKKPPVKIVSKIPTFIHYQQFPFYNSWMNYYLVEFNKSSKPYILEYKSRHWGEVNITF